MHASGRSPTKDMHGTESVDGWPGKEKKPDKTSPAEMRKEASLGWDFYQAIDDSWTLDITRP